MKLLKKSLSEIETKTFAIPKDLFKGFRQDLTDSQILLLAIIKNFDNEDGCTLSNKDLANLSGLDRRVIVYALKRLAELDLIKVVKSAPTKRAIFLSQELIELFYKKQEECFIIRYEWLIKHKAPLNYCLVWSLLARIDYQSQKNKKKKMPINPGNDSLANELGISTKAITRAIAKGQELKLLSAKTVRHNSPTDGSLKTYRSIVLYYDLNYKTETKKATEEEYDSSNNVKPTQEEIDDFYKIRTDYQEEYSAPIDEDEEREDFLDYQAENFSIV